MQTVYLSQNVYDRSPEVMRLLSCRGFHVELFKLRPKTNEIEPNSVLCISGQEVADLGGAERLLSLAKEIKLFKIVEVVFDTNEYNVLQKLAGKHLIVHLCSKSLGNSVEAARIVEFLVDHACIYACGDESTSELLNLSKRIAEKNVTMLINGPSGTGKEVLSKFVHLNSHRKDENFIAINCAAIPENMLEAVLFGHEKGSFTGASSSNSGIFRAAHKGTLLLDEISEMPLGLQAKLLRVIQERVVTPLGGSREIEIDVRLIATTNRDMQEEVRLGKFREDLYYRLNVFPVFKKPLCERPGDILAIATTLLSKHSKGSEGHFVLSAEAAELLIRHDWPGNVRELENVIQRALVISDTAVIQKSSILLFSQNTQSQCNDFIATALRASG